MGDPLEYEQDGMMPPAVTHTATCLVPLADENYQIYMFGGRTAAGASSDLWTFDVRNMEWDNPLGDGMPPEPRESGTLTRVLMRFVFLYGGIGADGQPMNDVNLLDLNTKTWSSHKPSPPLPRIGHVAGYASGALYIFGGTDGTASDSELHLFDCDALFPQTAALAFDTDPSKYMVVKPSNSLNMLSDRFTVECWVLPNSFPMNAPAVIRSSTSYGNGFGLIAIDEATARKYIQIDKDKSGSGPKERNPWEGCLAEAEALPTVAFFVNGMKKETSALLRLIPGEWSHIAATFDGKNLITYCNGKRSDYMTLDPVPEEPPTHPKDGELYVGAMPGKAGWDGLVDAVRLWNEPLSWEQIRSQMNDTLQGSANKAMIGQWSCNEGAGEQMWDSSTRANHGTLEGEVERVMCTRDRIEPAKTKSEVHIEASFEKLRQWRVDFEKRTGRGVTQADLLLAEESIRKTARRLGLIQ